MAGMQNSPETDRKIQKWKINPVRTVGTRISLGILFLVVAAGCASEGNPKKSKEEAAMGHDAQYCRSIAGLDGAGRNDPLAYRAQAHYNKCMKDRGWPGS